MDYKRVLYKNSHMEHEMGRVIKISTINQIFFGNSEPFCIVGKLELINLDIITKLNGIFYIQNNNINKYFEIVNNTNFDNMILFPYNYYKSFPCIKVPTHFKDMIEIIDGYIDYLTLINDHFSNTIKYILFNNNILNAEFVVAQNDVFIIKFNKIGNPIFINFTYDGYTDENFLSIIQPINKTNFDDIYQYHQKQLLMEDPKTFIITNIERVTGDIYFSKMIVSSYLHKTVFDTPIDGICELILWKNEKCKHDYIIFFIQKYPELVKLSNNCDTMTNFEGFNKFLLSLDIKYVSWEVKEQINELYYQITHELIKSFQLLYENK